MPYVYRVYIIALNVFIDEPKENEFQTRMPRVTQGAKPIMWNISEHLAKERACWEKKLNDGGDTATYPPCISQRLW